MRTKLAKLVQEITQKAQKLQALMEAYDHETDGNTVFDEPIQSTDMAVVIYLAHHFADDEAELLAELAEIEKHNGR